MVFKRIFNMTIVVFHKAYLIRFYIRGTTVSAIIRKYFTNRDQIYPSKAK